MVEYGHVGGIASIGYGDASACGLRLGCIENIPTPPDVSFEPGMKVHRFEFIQVTNNHACRDAQAAAQRYPKMRHVMAHPFALLIDLYC